MLWKRGGRRQLFQLISVRVSNRDMSGASTCVYHTNWNLETKELRRQSGHDVGNEHKLV